MDEVNILNSKLNEIYHPQLSIVEIILPFLIIFIVMCITLTLMIQIDLTTSSLNWDKNKCIPKYMRIYSKRRWIRYISIYSKKF